MPRVLCRPSQTQQGPGDKFNQEECLLPWAHTLTLSLPYTRTHGSVPSNPPRTPSRRRRNRKRTHRRHLRTEQCPRRLLQLYHLQVITVISCTTHIFITLTIITRVIHTFQQAPRQFRLGCEQVPALIDPQTQPRLPPLHTHQLSSPLLCRRLRRQPRRRRHPSGISNRLHHACSLPQIHINTRHRLSHHFNRLSTARPSPME